MFDEYSEEPMDEEQLRQLISSLCVLSKEGSIPLHTFSVLVSAAPCEKLANQLHQRWLSEQNFTKIAANIILHRQHIFESDLTLFSCCLAHVLSDFRSRHQMRKENRLLFRNSVRAMLDFYPIYKEIDAIVSECLVEPMFISLNELIYNEADEKDVQATAEIIIEHGDMLSKIKPTQCNDFIVALRTHLCDSHLSPVTRRLVLRAIDLWTYKWNDEMIPFCIKQFNEISMELRQKHEGHSETSLESNDERRESIV